ncbi:hypothetical protein [Methylocystis silviterrae]|nr:hypothetical protein [Methylocystis silviterrae]
MNFDPNMLPELVSRAMWGVFALLATELLVRLFICFMRETERPPW